MPFMSYQTSVYDAVVNAGRLMKEGRANAVKLEGGMSVCPQIKAITDCDIPVVAHIGLTPQSVNAFGGFKVQCKTSCCRSKSGRSRRRMYGRIGMRTSTSCHLYYRAVDHTNHRNRGWQWL